MKVTTIPPEPVKPTIVLELTYEEACMVRQIMFESARHESNSIYYELLKVTDALK